MHEADSMREAEVA